MSTDSGAIADLTKAIELKPDNPVAYFKRGVAKSILKDLRGAITDFNKVIKLMPDKQEAYLGRGIAKSVLEAPDNSDAYFLEA